MQFDLGLQGLAIVTAMALLFGLIAQLVLGRWAHSHWLWLTGFIGWVVGALFMSEVVFAGATATEIQPVIDGLAFDESMLGGLIGGLIAIGLTAIVSRRQTHGPTPHPV